MADTIVVGTRLTRKILADLDEIRRRYPEPKPTRSKLIRSFLEKEIAARNYRSW